MTCLWTSKRRKGKCGGKAFMRATMPMRLILKYCLAAAALACCGYVAAVAASARVMTAPPAWSGTGGAVAQVASDAALTFVSDRKRRHKTVRRRKSRASARRPAAQRRRAPNVTLRAVLAAGCEPLRQGLSWRVFQERHDRPGAKKKLVWSGGGAEPEIHLNPGKYRVEAEYGLAQNSTIIDAKANKPITATLVLNAGTIRVRGVAMAGGPALRDMFFKLHSAQAGPEAADLGRSTRSETLFHAPAGAYRLHAEHGLASTDMMVTVEAGREASAEAVMNTGVLTLSARARRDGPPLSGVVFTVYDGGEAGSKREVVRSVRDEPRLDLPAGRYRVVAVLGLAREERKVEIAAGKVKTVPFLLNAGGVRLFSVLAGSRQPLDRNLLYKVYRLSQDGAGAGKTLATTTNAKPTLFLKQGRYRIECQYGWHNARQVREVEVKAGETVEAGFEHLAAGVTLKLVARPGGRPLGRVKWTLKYSGGGTVLISQDASPALTLQAGRYQAMARHGNKTYSRVFEAAANSEQTVEIIAE